MHYFGVISVLPETLAYFQHGVVGRAIENRLAHVQCWNPRDFTSRPYRQVDDKPYGGGPGMVMMYAPLNEAINHAKEQMPAGCKTVYLSPQGKNVTQQDLQAVVDIETPVLFIAGRYEGIDERVIQQHVDEEWSLGDFVLSGGELAAMVFIDAMVRLIPGSLGHPCSAAKDSFADGLLECPQYTRPATIGGMEVPPILLKGHHVEIERWRRKQSLGITWRKRPDLLEKVGLTELDKQLLVEYKNEQSGL